MDYLLVRKVNDKATLPQRQTNGAAGYDLYSCVDTIIPSGGAGVVDIGIEISLPSGTYGRIASRSGLAVVYGINVGAGVIDRDYRGPIKVFLFNHGKQDFKVNVGERIAQLIIECIKTPIVVEVKNLEKTERGEAGFGSTGK